MGIGSAGSVLVQDSTTSAGCEPARSFTVMSYILASS